MHQNLSYLEHGRRFVLNMGGRRTGALAPPCTAFVRAGGGCGRGWPPPVMGVRGYYPRKNLENLFKIVHFRVKYGNILPIKQPIDIVLNGINFAVEIFDQRYIYRYTKRDRKREIESKGTNIDM